MASSSSISSLLFIHLLLHTLLFALPSESYPIQTICRRTKIPSFCSKLLGSHPNASLQELDRIVIDATIPRVTKAISKIESLTSETEDTNLRIIYAQCSLYYRAALSALNAGKDKLKSGKYSGLNDAAGTVFRGANSCKARFITAPSQPVPIASDNNDIYLLGNVFVVVSRILTRSD